MLLIIREILKIQYIWFSKESIMKKGIYLILAVILIGGFASCKRCYDCSNGTEVIKLCDYNKKKINSDISIYESRGYTCVKD